MIENQTIIQSKNNETINNKDLFCRICMSNEPVEGILSACECNGQIGQVHELCLMQWAEKNHKIKYSTQSKMYELQCQKCKKQIPIFNIKSKKLRSCHQIKQLIFDRVGRFVLQILSIVLVILSMSYLSKKVIIQTNFSALWVFDTNDFSNSLQKYLPIVSLAGTYVSVLVMLAKFFGEYFIDSSKGYRINTTLQQQSDIDQQSENIILPTKNLQKKINETLPINKYEQIKRNIKEKLPSKFSKDQKFNLKLEEL